MRQHVTKINYLLVVLYLQIYTGITSSDDVCQSSVCHQTAVNLLQSMDSSVDPCDNFYSYACANFIQQNPVPESKIEYGQFTRVGDQVRIQIQEILTSGADESDEVANTSKPLASAIAAYNTCLATNESISQVLELIVYRFGGCPLINGDHWDPDNYDVTAALYNNMLYGNSPLFSVNVGVDEKNTSVNIIYIDQVEMNIEIEYYLDPEGYHHVLEAYHRFIVNVTKALTGDVISNVDAMAQDIIKLETSIANISSTFIEKQNSTRRYNRMTIGQLQNLTDPQMKIIDWVDFLKSLLKADDVTEDEPIIVNELSYMARLFTILNATDVNLLANYLAWNFIVFVSEEAYGAIEHFNFQFQQVIGGAKNLTERWRKCVDKVSEAWSYAIGQQYVRKYINDSTPSEAEKMLKLLQNSFIERLHLNDFMDNETKSVAVQKVNGMYRLVGYPRWMMDQHKLEEYYEDYPSNSTGHYLLDALETAMAVTETTFATLRDPTDPQSFDESPMDVNAYYSPTSNAIIVPLGILNPPFYQSGAPSAVNFGGLGSLLGHEITHGFDNDGRKYDQKGNLQPWWPQMVVDRFEVQSKCFVRQYSTCCPIKNMVDADQNKCVNGQQTLGENMADNGGLRASYQAWKQWTTEHGDDLKLPGMENFTSDQIFYLSYANLWCESTTLGSLLAELTSDEHSPETCRVNGALANAEPFANAFNCSKGPVNRGRKRCSVW